MRIIFKFSTHTPIENYYQWEVFFMTQLSEKELASIQELLADEDLLVKKFKMLAEHATDEKLKNKMLEISDKHQEHFNEIYSKLS